MKKLLFILSIITFSIEATQITLHKYDSDHSDISEIKEILRTIYLNAFEQVYGNYWTPQFEQRYITFFDDHIEKIKHSDGLLLIVAKKWNHIAGWMLCSCSEQSAIIEIICVDPKLQRQGIGKALILSIKNHASKIKSVFVATQKINPISPLFYENLGFIKTNSMHSDYDADEKQEYEYLI